MNLLNHCSGIFPRLNFSVFVSGLLCEFVQPLLVHIFLSQLFNYCCVHHIFLLSAKIASNRTVVFIPIESFLMFLAQKLMYFPRLLHQFSSPPIPYSCPGFVFWLQKAQLSRRWWRLRRVWRRLAPSVYGHCIWKGFVLRKHNDQDCVWAGYGGWSRVFMGPASTPRTSSGGREASRPVVTAQIAGDHLLSERYSAKSDKHV